MDINEIVNEYYDIIVDLEKFLEYRNSLSKEEEKNMSAIAKQIRDAFEEYYAKRAMSWRLIKGDVKNEMYKVFESPDQKKILPYLNASDMLSDTLMIYLEDDLTDYYQKKGFDIGDDKIKEEILDKAFDWSTEDEIDHNIFSSDTITLNKISKRMDVVCDKLYKYYKNKIFENAEEIQIL